MPIEPIAPDVLRVFAETYDYDQVIVIARKIGATTSEEVVMTYGRNDTHKAVAASIGNFFKFRVVKWAEEARVFFGKDL